MNYNAKNSLLLQLLKLFGAYIVSQLLIVFIFAAAVSGDEIPEKYDLPMVIIAILLAFAVNMVIAYYLYIVLCLKNPHDYFDLADQKKIYFVFLNIVTKTMAYKNAWGMLHKALLSSPWFMKHGASTEGRMPEWYCTDKDVALQFGSSPNDVIGLDILCLTGDTKIWEANGKWTPIKDLENKTIKVFNYNIEDNYVALSDTCKVEQTSTTQDLIEIEMIDGSCIRCTPNHRFLLKDGTYKRAKDLTDEDELEDGMSI